MHELDRFTLERYSVDDLTFAKQPLRTHPERPEPRVGYRLVAVAQYAIPSWVRLSYVVGRSGMSDEYVYTVVWPDEDALEPKIVDVRSESEARGLLLKELATQVQNRSTPD